jgi:hypothetical protein
LINGSLHLVRQIFLLYDELNFGLKKS